MILKEIPRTIWDPSDETLGCEPGRRHQLSTYHISNIPIWIRADSLAGIWKLLRYQGIKVKG